VEPFNAGEAKDNAVPGKAGAVLVTVSAGFAGMGTSHPEMKALAIARTSLGLNAMSNA